MPKHLDERLAATDESTPTAEAASALRVEVREETS